MIAGPIGAFAVPGEGVWMMATSMMRQLAVATFCGLAAIAPSAEAAVIVTIEQVGPNVVATASGSINTAALTFVSATTNSTFMRADLGILAVGGALDTPSTPNDIYVLPNPVSPTNFGTGGIAAGIAFGGDFLRIDLGLDIIQVPQGYVSGAPIAGSSTFAGSLQSLGLTPGSYVQSWGSGDTADSVTINVLAATPVPEPASLLLFGIPAAGLLLRRRATRG